MRRRCRAEFPAAAAARRCEPRVRTGHDEDAVLAARLDEDRRDAARAIGNDAEVPRVNAVTAEIFTRERAERVVAHVAEVRRRDGLIRALAAVRHEKARRLERFARSRHPRHVGDEVHHVTADDGDASHRE